MEEETTKTSNSTMGKLFQIFFTHDSFFFFFVILYIKKLFFLNVLFQVRFKKQKKLYDFFF